MSELVGPYVHRPLARPLVRVFVRTGTEPIVATVAGLAACLSAAALFAAGGDAALVIAAGTLVMLGAILDCVDGGAAEQLGLVSPFRSWLDTIADRVGDTAIALAITAGATSGHPSGWAWALGGAATVAMVLSSYSRKEFEIRFREPFPTTLVDRLARRDVRSFGIFVGALALHPFVAVVALGAVSLASVVAAVVKGARLDANQADVTP